MRSANLIPIIAAVAFLLSSCGSGSSKFEGKWIPEAYAGEAKEQNRHVLIKKEGDRFKMYAMQDGKIFDATSQVNFYYDQEKDILTGTVGNESVEIMYDKDKKSIKLRPRRDSDMYASGEIELIPVD